MTIALSQRNAGHDTTDPEFAAWTRRVSWLCFKRFGLTLSDLPDVPTRDAFDEGVSPLEFFEEEVLRVVRDDFGSLVDGDEDD